MRLALERAADLYWAFLVWSRLSDATHPHPYELAPTVGELRRWHNEVTELVNLLDHPPSAK
jgi:hypothetical protein